VAGLQELLYQPAPSSSRSAEDGTLIEAAWPPALALDQLIGQVDL